MEVQAVSVALWWTGAEAIAVPVQQGAHRSALHCAGDRGDRPRGAKGEVAAWRGPGTVHAWVFEGG